MFSVEENSARLLLGGAAGGAAACSASSTSASSTAIAERIALPPCVCPPSQRAEDEPCVAVLWRGSIIRRRYLPRSRQLWQNHESSTDCRRTSMGRSMLVAVLAAAGLLAGRGQRDGAASLADAASLRAAAGRRRATAGACARSTAPPTFQASASDTWPRAARGSTAGYGYRAPVYGYYRARGYRRACDRDWWRLRPLPAPMALNARSALARRP